MDKETRNKISADIEASTIPEELKALYLMANATELMSVQCFERIKRVFRRHGYRAKENELLTGITQYCRMVKMATFHFSERIEPQIQGATFFAGDGGRGTSGAEAYDSFNDDAGELCRLILLYIDRTSKNKDGYGRVFKALRSLPPGGLLNDEDISKYKQK